MKISAYIALIVFCLSISIGGATTPEESAEEQCRGLDDQTRFNHPRPSKKTNSAPQNSPPSSPRQQRNQAEWTIVILIQASNNLESFAHKNMREMMRWGSSSRVNILVDLHKGGDKSWKYRIEQGTCVVEEVSARTTKTTIAEEVTHTARWAITNYPAERYAFIFWNHGLGCIDPAQDKNKPAYLRSNWRSNVLLGEEPIPEDNEALTRATKNIIPPDRSILFDDERHTYLSNVDLRLVLQTISTQLLNGKKIDLIGMDACLMGMLEIADQIKDYAHYFVASEEFEFANGWPYGDIIERLSARPTSARDLGKIIVEAYEQHYLSRTSYFTQSCIDLGKIGALKDNIDSLAVALLLARKQDSNRVRLFIQQTRSQTLSFSLSDYMDLHSFYQELLKTVQHVLDSPPSRIAILARVDVELLKKIKTILVAGVSILKEAVVANTAGRYLSRASGLAIYFPQRGIDASYATTEFAKTTSWPLLLSEQLDGRH